MHSAWRQSPQETQKETAQTVSPSEENKTLTWAQPEKDSIVRGYPVPTVCGVSDVTLGHWRRTWLVG